MRAILLILIGSLQFSVVQAQSIEVAIRKALHSWDVGEVRQSNGVLFVKVRDRAMTMNQFVPMIAATCTGMPKGAAFREIHITNPHGYGFAFEDSKKGCATVMQPRNISTEVAVALSTHSISPRDRVR